MTKNITVNVSKNKNGSVSCRFFYIKEYSYLKSESLAWFTSYDFTFITMSMPI